MSSPRRPVTSALTAPTAAAGLTCQELLALSGALGAALPTPLALPVASAAEDATVAANKYVHQHRRNNNNNNNQLALRTATNSNSSILPTLAMALWPEPYGRMK
jgi:hypothetical protein